MRVQKQKIFRKIKRESQDEIQKITDKYIAKMDEALKIKNLIFWNLIINQYFMLMKLLLEKLIYSVIQGFLWARGH